MLITIKSDPCVASLHMVVKKWTVSGDVTHEYTLEVSDMIGVDGNVAFVPAIRRLAVHALREMGVCTFELEQEPFVILQSEKPKEA